MGKILQNSGKYFLLIEKKRLFKRHILKGIPAA
jgi:hypothetical protein